MATNLSQSVEDGFDSDLDAYYEDLIQNDAENYASDISLPDSSDSEDDYVPLAKHPAHLRKVEADLERQIQHGEWSQDLLPIKMSEFRGNPGPVNILDEDQREVDFFMLIFTNSLFETIATETNRYATELQKKKPDPSWKAVTPEEIKAYIGFMVVMGIIQAPTLDMYWSTDSMFKPAGIAERITRTRFDKISQYFHVVDNSRNPPRGDPEHDKLSHVRPILEQIRHQLSTNYRPHREASIDEAMIGYTGRLGFKQYVPMKPTKRGIKVWVRADPHNGYINDFQVYVGKTDNDVERGLGERVVLDLVRPIMNLNHHIFCDNYFTSVQLFEDLLRNNTYGCGTVRINRKGLPEALKVHRFKNQGESILLQKGNLVATGWHDKKNVYFLSTNFDPTKSTTVERRQKNGTIKNVQCPAVVKMYSEHMNGVDRADQLRAMYAIGRKAAKWWKYLFWFLVDISITASYILMRESPNHTRKTKTGKPKPLRQLEYRQNLAKQLIGTYCQKRKRAALKENFVDGTQCWITSRKKNKCKECLKENKRREPKYGCSACDVNLCPDCFKPYHLAKFPDRYTH